MMKKRVLFVCLGNICRSPGAAAVFAEVVRKSDLSDSFEIDSAGTGTWHVGEPVDSQMQDYAQKRGYLLTHKARQFDPQRDFDNFDIIIGMDNDNIETLKALARNDEERKKIYKMTDFSRAFGYKSVPDPFMGGEEGFELVLDLLEDACKGLFWEII
jgi:protein-tyrosine phosphatase